MLGQNRHLLLGELQSFEILPRWVGVLVGLNSFAQPVHMKGYGVEEIMDAARAFHIDLVDGAQVIGQNLDQGFDHRRLFGEHGLEIGAGQADNDAVFHGHRMGHAFRAVDDGHFPE